MIKKVLYLWSEHCAPQRQEIIIGEGQTGRPMAKPPLSMNDAEA